MFGEMAAVMDNRHPEEDDGLEYINISREQGDRVASGSRGTGRTTRRASSSQDVDVMPVRQRSADSSQQGRRRDGALQSAGGQRRTSSPQGKVDSRVVNVSRGDGTVQSTGGQRRASSPQGGENGRVVSAPRRDGTPRSTGGQRRTDMSQEGGTLHVVGAPPRDGMAQNGGGQRRTGTRQGGEAGRVVSVPRRDGTPQSAEKRRRVDKPQNGEAGRGVDMPYNGEPRPRTGSGQNRRVQGGGYGAPRSSSSGRRDAYPRQGNPAYRAQGGYNGGKRRRGRKKGITIPVICLLFLVALVVGAFVYINSLAYKRCRVEAGGEVTASDFIRKGDVNAYFTSDSAAFDTCEPGEYKVKVKSGLFTHRCTLIVEDTKPPTAQAVRMRIGVGESCEPEDFVENVEDVTAVTVAFVAQPDFGKTGRQQVSISLTDKGNNTVIIDSELYISAVLADVYMEMGGTAPTVESFLLVSQPAEFVTDMNSLDYNRPGDYTVNLKVDGEEETTTLHVQDKVPPVINGAKDLEIYTGDGVAYRKNVTVTDNWPEDLSLDVDSSQVNTDEVGVYPVIYTATDAAGNTSSVTVSLTVKARAYDMDTVNELADAVLAEIITPEMSQREKVRAIYNYNMSHIGYIEHSEKGDWVRAAYEGLKQGRGDCYVYACTAKLLLTRAGITNMDIEKIPSDSEHYWNLVDIGDGWYHFDTTPRKDHPTIFMWTDEQMMEYSAAHKDSHNYNHDDYPEVN